MKNIIHNLVTLSIGFVGLIGGAIWGYYSQWDIESVILSLISFLEIVAYFTVSKEEQNKKEVTHKLKNKNNQKVEVTVNNFANSKQDKNHLLKRDKNAVIETKKNKVGILFIDDDKNFNIVGILKDSKWKKTKTVTDIKSLDINQVKNSEIIFVDINGVGSLLDLEYEGLDLALMLKQKYPEKKIIIYSANKNSNSFHEAWNIVDSRLEKNALPYQFQNLVENYSLEFYN